MRVWEALTPVDDPLLCPFSGHSLLESNSPKVGARPHFPCRLQVTEPFALSQITPYRVYNPSGQSWD